MSLENGQKVIIKSGKYELITNDGHTFGITAEYLELNKPYDGILLNYIDYPYDNQWNVLIYRDEIEEYNIIMVHENNITAKI